MSEISTPVTVVAAIVVAVLLGAVVLFQAALALGAPWGRAAYGGASAELPTRFRISSAVAVFVWAGVALVTLQGGGLLGGILPEPALTVVLWVFVGLHAVGCVLNAITRSTLERAIWLPVTLMMLAGTLTVVLTR